MTVPRRSDPLKPESPTLLLGVRLSAVTPHILIIPTRRVLTLVRMRSCTYANTQAFKISMSRISVVHMSATNSKNIGSSSHTHKISHRMCLQLPRALTWRNLAAPLRPPTSPPTPHCQAATARPTRFLKRSSPPAPPKARPSEDASAQHQEAQSTSKEVPVPEALAKPRASNLGFACVESSLSPCDSGRRTPVSSCRAPPPALHDVLGASMPSRPVQPRASQARFSLSTLPPTRLLFSASPLTRTRTSQARSFAHKVPPRLGYGFCSNLLRFEGMLLHTSSARPSHPRAPPQPRSRISSSTSSCHAQGVPCPRHDCPARRHADA